MVWYRIIKAINLLIYVMNLSIFYLLDVDILTVIYFWSIIVHVYRFQLRKILLITPITSVIYLEINFEQ